MRRILAWRKSRPVRWTANVLVILLALQGLIGLPQLPDQLRSWPPLITGAWNGLHRFLEPLSGDLGRWIVFIAVMALLLLLNVPWERLRADPQRDYTVTYDGDLVPRPRPSPPPAPTADAQDFLDVTSEYLVAFFEGRTELQGQASVKGYIGKRMRVSGTIEEVHTNDRLIVTLQRPTAMSFLYFGSEWSDQFANLSQGDAIQVVGHIESVHRQGVSLENCQLAQSSRAAIS